ncbi:Geranylgeranyl transferase type-2 subunit alpha [Golovinomyces cichoracearum]|uniref:Geranylgeranyl transferase type-2 subunit alpha n=1 Tax=Golovinomyces cichoracearum TaxID=62708 RepID=A0A420J3D0_9PEZI|nr:Geranylgeranyl transferase type-2 subunit alpha [Golovinomyces cichoracearum]
MASHGVARPATVIPRTKQEKDSEQKEITEYKELENSIRVKAAEHLYTSDLLDLTSKLLKKNPEYYTLWNIRRRILILGLFSNLQTSSQFIESSKQSLISTLASEATSSEHNEEKKNHVFDLISADLRFLVPIMLRFPKCYWLWNYRLWLLEQANERLDLKISRDLWHSELNLVGKMLVKDSRNFHGWGYRREVISQLESSRLDGKSMVETEFEYTTKMIHALNGLSNFSAWHRRSKLIPQLLIKRNSDSAARRQFLDDEFELIISAIYTDSYPYQQSAWFYYQFLMTIITEPSGCQVVLDFTVDDRCKYVRRQLDVLKEMLDGAEDCKWIYNAAIDYIFALCLLENRILQPEERMDCLMWLNELKKLDPYRKGRWGDLEKRVV